ncbi:MAG: cytochrome-c peroxidase, partial [Methylocystis sp.]
AFFFIAVTKGKTEPLGLPAVPDEIAGTSVMRQLGEKLFFDRGLAVNGTLSCAMCHIPAQGYASNQSALSIGIEGRSLRRNAPSLYNIAFKRYLFLDGRETDLSAQIWVPLLAPDEMGNPAIGPVLTRLRNNKDYAIAFNIAFPGEGVTMTTLGRAIAAYEASLLRGNSRFDEAIFKGMKEKLTEQEWLGYEIFSSKASCSGCHEIGNETALFSDNKWHNTGIAFRYQNNSKNMQVQLAEGVMKSINLGSLGLNTKPLRDVGRFEITNNPSDRWAYVTPFLRGVRETAPYMHDGSLKTLEEVVDFYDHGGGQNPELDQKIRPLNLTAKEKAALIAFLLVL